MKILDEVEASGQGIFYPFFTAPLAESAPSQSA